MKYSGIIIDDDQDVSSSLKKVLENEDMNILGMASNGEEGIKLFEKYHPKFVMLDMKMPKYDGEYFLKKYGKQKFRTKIIVYSGYPDQEPELTNVAAIIQKGSPVREMIKTIENLCS